MRVQCRHLEDNDFLGVSSMSGKAVASVPCTSQNLQGKIAPSDYRTVRRDDGTRALSSVRIKGETVAHFVINE